MLCHHHKVCLVTKKCRLAHIKRTFYVIWQCLICLKLCLDSCSTPSHDKYNLLQLTVLNDNSKWRVHIIQLNLVQVITVLHMHLNLKQKQKLYI